MAYYGRWKPYVPVATRRARAQKRMAALRKKGVDIQPIKIEGRKIARTFWGEAWCNHLESFSDYANRLPRGRTYVRNGSVCHLGIKKGKIEAKVSGSDIYAVKVEIKALPIRQWNAIKQQCSGQIGSLIELLKGDLSDNIMQLVTDRKDGLFPKPAEISFACDCPDWAGMCKHVAAVLYGVGNRLDQDPALLFHLRGVDHEELIDLNSEVAVPTGTGRGGSKRLTSGDLGDVFGIDLELDPTTVPTPGPSKAKRKASSAKKKSTLTKAKKTSKKTTTTARKKSASPKKTASSAKKKSSQRSSLKKTAATEDGQVKKKTSQPKSKRKTAKKPSVTVTKSAAERPSRKKRVKKSRQTLTTK